jgi:hypothetical protein
VAGSSLLRAGPGSNLTETRPKGLLYFFLLLLLAKIPLGTLGGVPLGPGTEKQSLPVVWASGDCLKLGCQGLT